MLPVFTGHPHAFDLAVDHALAAVYTAVHMVFENVSFCGPVDDHKLDGIRRAILDAQTAAGAQLGIVIQGPAIPLGRLDPLGRVKLRRR